MEENKLQVFLETDGFNHFSSSIFALLLRINNNVLEVLIESGKAFLMKRNTILNGVQKVGDTSIYFGIEYAFYSDDADLLEANCVNVNCGLRDSGSSLLVSFSMSSIYEEIDLFDLNYSQGAWEAKVSDEKSISIIDGAVRLVSEFIDRTQD